MKPSIRGLLLSGLIYPGAGQLALGRKWEGAGFIALTTAALLLGIIRVFFRLAAAVQQTMSAAPESSADGGKIMELAGQAVSNGWTVEIGCLITLLGCWVAACLHAYWVGRSLDASQRFREGE